MNPVLRFLLALALVLSIAPIGSGQERPVPSEKSRADAKARWRKLSPAQRDELLRRHREFKSLPAEARARIRNNIARLERMSPEERQAFRRKLASLSPEERGDLIARGAGLAQMPQPKRNLIRLIADLVGPMTPEQRDRIHRLRGRERDQYIRSTIEQKFAEKFLKSAEERAMFQAAPLQERMRRIRHVLEPQIRALHPPRKDEAQDGK